MGDNEAKIRNRTCILSFSAFLLLIAFFISKVIILHLSAMKKADIVLRPRCYCGGGPVFGTMFFPVSKCPPPVSESLLDT